MMISRFTFAAVVAVSISGTVAADSIDPLSERIWSNRDQSWIDFETLIDTLESSPRIVIGERHGFAPHQDRIALILQALAERGRYPRLVMEHLKPSQIPTLEAYRQENPEYAGGLGTALEWWDTGWPAFKYYEPIFAVAFAARLELVAGDSAKKSPGISKYVFNYWQRLFASKYCLRFNSEINEERSLLQTNRDGGLRLELERKGKPVLLVVGRDHLVPLGELLNNPATFVALGDFEGTLTDADLFEFSKVSEPKRRPCPR